MKDRTMMNAEGYIDKTAHAAINNVVREEREKTTAMRTNSARDEAAEVLIKTIKNMIWLSGFKLTDRIKLEDPKSGKKYL